MEGRGEGTGDMGRVSEGVGGREGGRERERARARERERERERQRQREREREIDR